MYNRGRIKHTQENKMITAHTLQLAEKERAEAESTVKQIAPNAHFVFNGIDNENIYFNVVAKADHIANYQIVDLEQKTRFELIKKVDMGIALVFKSEYKMQLMDR